VRLPFILFVAVVLIAAACSKSPTAPERVSTAASSATVGQSVHVANPAETSTYPVEWTLTQAQCPQLWSNSVTGEGTGHLTLRQTTLGNGTFQLSATETVHGIATDEEGREFRFNYTNTFQLHDGSALSVNGTDVFNLVGPAGATLQLHVGFTGIIRVDDEGNVMIDELKMRGPLECDPI
jgi:hypothetical protein